MSTNLTDAVRDALAKGGVIDMTTSGRRSGEARRIEIELHNVGGRLYISGLPEPSRRSWMANLRENPRLTVHLKGAVRADLPGSARIVDGEAERQEVISEVARAWKRDDVDLMVRQSPLIEVTLELGPL